MKFKHGKTEVVAEQYVPGAMINEDFLKVLCMIGNVKMHGDSTTVVLPDGEKKLNAGDWIIQEDTVISVLPDDKFAETYKALN